jgi:uncharacterized membrane protein YkvA (DUF1232 family)
MKKVEILRGLKNYESEASEVTSGRRSVRALDSAIDITQRVPVLKDLVNDVPVMVSMVKDYVKGRYKRVPAKTITLLTAALLYLINPADIVPDYIPGAGYLDDAAVISFVLNSVKDDVDKYKYWKETY